MGPRMSVNDTIASLATGTYTVTRTGGGARTNGRYTPGAETTFPIVAGIEPVTGRELRDTPEGQRGDEVIMIFTTTRLRTRQEGEPDRIAYDPPGSPVVGDLWTVTKVDVLEGFGEVHYEVQACRAPHPAGTVP
jgi:hypothetical protein